MKLTKDKKELIFANLKYKFTKKGNSFHINWDAGEVTYNANMRQDKVFTEQQYSEIYKIVNTSVNALREEMNQRFEKIEYRLDALEERMDKLEERMDDLANKINLLTNAFEKLFEILNRNGIK